jgi:hypothetical protein
LQKPEDNVDWFNETQYQNIGQYLVLYFEQNVWRHYLDRNLLGKNTVDPYETYLKIWKDFPIEHKQQTMDSFLTLYENQFLKESKYFNQNPVSDFYFNNQQLAFFQVI